MRHRIGLEAAIGYGPVSSIDEGLALREPLQKAVAANLSKWRAAARSKL